MEVKSFNQILGIIITSIGAVVLILGIIFQHQWMLFSILIIGVGLHLIFKDKHEPRYDYMTHGDFKKYYDKNSKRNIWVLGYFGGGSINISDAEILAREYGFRNDVPYDKVLIDEIHTSRRFKSFKFIFSTEIQLPEVDAEIMDNVYEWLCD